MLVIGLCGASGSGKGTIAALLKKRGINCLDTDALYHRLTKHDSECSRALISAFGRQIASEENGINRTVLSEEVFSDKTGTKLGLLNRISHSFILLECRKWIQENQRKGVKAVCIDAPMLFESGFDRQCDITVAVMAKNEGKIRRIMKRDGITRDQAKSRLSHQMSDEELKNRCDFTISNNGSLDELKKEVELLLKKILP